MRAYMFLMDFLEVVSKETSNLLKSNQALMKEILEAVKTSEEVLNSFINVNKEKVCSNFHAS